MIKDTKWVASVELGETSKKTPMWTITWHDGKKDKVFDLEWARLCEEASAGGLAVYLEKEQKGNYWNITKLELMKDKIEAPPVPLVPSPAGLTELDTAQGKPIYAPQEVGMWWNNLGARIGDGSLEKDYPNSHVQIKSQYYKKMSEVTGVAFKE